MPLISVAATAAESGPAVLSFPGLLVTAGALASPACTQ
jgi:hypothetical protein